MIATALLIISALPIIRPRYFAWNRGESFFELSIEGFLPPHGAQRGIHFETFPLGPHLRFRVLSIDFAFVAWEFVITEHLPVERPNQALERTAARCAFTFQMIKTVSIRAKLASGGGRSALSR